MSCGPVHCTSAAPVTRHAHNALGQRVFKTEPVYASVSSPPEGEEKGYLAALAAFFSRMFSPQTQPAELLGTAFVYGEDGALLAEMGTGGAQSTGVTIHVWLPTPSGPMPVAAIINGATYAVHADHLNTPRRLTNSAGQAVWQWKYSAFGDEEPTRAAYRFAHPSEGFTSNVPDVLYGLRYPGQYADLESGLHDNHFRTYHPWDGRYTQFDPIGLRGGWNGFSYAENSPIQLTDPEGLKPPLSSRPSTRELARSGGTLPVFPPTITRNEAARRFIEHIGNVPTSPDGPGANWPGVTTPVLYIPVSLPPRSIENGCWVSREPDVCTARGNGGFKIYCGPSFSSSNERFLGATPK